MWLPDRKFLLHAAVLLLFCGAASADDRPLKVLKQLSLSSTEISKVLSGDVVSKTLDTDDKREVAVLGVATVNVPPESIVSTVRDITNSKKGKEVLAIGKFSDYKPDEMKTLSLNEDEHGKLEECKVKDCDPEMPAEWINKLNGEKDPEKRNEILRELLSGYAKDYIEKGGKVVVNYDNKDNVVMPQKEFEQILAASPYLSELAPAFHQYLKDYPEKPVDGAENFVYWSREKFGFKPVISLTHVSITPWATPDGNGWVIASRQIYAEHYYVASLGLTFLMNRPLEDGKTMGSYMIYINRSRIDILGGFLSSLRRAIAIPRIRSGLESHMKAFRDRLEDKTADQGKND